MEIILGFIFGIVSSWIFWRYLLLLKPKLEIPEVIEIAKNKNNQIEYIYKTKNLGRRQIIDVSMRATICERINDDPEHSLRLVHKLKIELDKADVLSPKSKSLDPWGLPNYRSFHIQQIDDNTNEPVDIYGLLSDDKNRLIITIKSTDGISGTTIVTRKTYTKANIIS